MYSIHIGTGTCGVAAGAEPVLAAFREQVGKLGLRDTVVGEVGCNGMCFAEPLVEVRHNGTRHLYGRVTPDRVERILKEHVQGGQPVREWVVLENGDSGPEADFLARQRHIVLRNCGDIDPMSI
ncbi:MAG: (2Fe-2S) ferredoxin domain-containing protein, partial [Deltaproteobacteria bacterium]|nr:(2Fe-2S) ferredoxin domain-containing protein [Deltaproteobacteria bacterium]